MTPSIELLVPAGMGQDCIMAVSARALPLETPAMATVDFGSLRTIHRFGIFLLWSLCRERQAMPQVKGPPGILSNSSIRCDRNLGPVGRTVGLFSMSDQDLMSETRITRDSYDFN